MRSGRPLLTYFAIFACTVTFVFSQKGARDKQLAELADAERAFAAFTVKEGFRSGFIKYFADDGIGFGPHPERTREKLMKTPPATGPQKVIFNWAPMFGDISAAGDLGYTTGPVLYTDVTENPGPPRHGMYFSVWQKQGDGSWKVVVDMGVDTPQAVAPIDTGFIAAAPVMRSTRPRQRKVRPLFFRTAFCRGRPPPRWVLSVLIKVISTPNSGYTGRGTCRLPTYPV